MATTPKNQDEFMSQAVGFVKKAKAGGVSNTALKNTLMFQFDNMKQEQTRMNAANAQALAQSKFDYSKIADERDFDYRKTTDDRKYAQEQKEDPKNFLQTMSGSGQSYLQDVTDGQGNFVDIIRQNPQLSMDEKLALAQANINKYGQFKESPQEVASMLGLSAKDVADSGLVGVDPNDVGASDPYTWATKNNVLDLITAKTAGEREGQIKALQQLGPEEYRRSMPLDDLLSDKELGQREKGTDLINQLSQIRTIIEDGNSSKNIQGVGPFGQHRPDWMTNAEGTQLKQLITGFTAEKMKELSGAAVSDSEVERLGKAFMQEGNTEENIAVKAKTLQNALEIGQEMQEIAKRNKLTLDEAYKQHGASAFQSKGESVPNWIKEGGVSGSGSMDAAISEDEYNDLFDELGI